MAKVVKFNTCHCFYLVGVSAEFGILEGAGMGVRDVDLLKLSNKTQCLHSGKSGSQTLPKIALGLPKINSRKSGTPNF